MNKLIFLSTLLLLLMVSPVWAEGPVYPTSFTDPMALPTLSSSGQDRILDHEVKGQAPGGAHYRMVVPEDWNGDLVIWNHGFSLEEPDENVDLGPAVDLNLEQGYAVAASSYRQKGWALFYTREDLNELYQEFVARFGAPSRVLVYGASLGGLVTAQALEQGELGNVVGAMALCGAMAGSRVFDGSVDLRLVYDVIADGIPKAALPGGAEGLPKDSDLTEFGMALAVNAATGILLPDAQRSPLQQANLAKILRVSALPEEFLLTDMWYSTFGLSDLVHDPAKLGGAIAAGNAGVNYDDAEINAAIERIAPNPVANNRLGNYFIPTGQVGDVKIVQLQTDKDGLVIVENAGEYSQVVPTINLTTVIVVEDEPSHCNFTEAEVYAAWESLLEWVDGGVKPDATGIQTACENAPTKYPGPCRINPNFEIPDMDGRIQPRTRWQILFQPQVIKP